jgi:hypothetical protein
MTIEILRYAQQKAGLSSSSCVKDQAVIHFDFSICFLIVLDLSCCLAANSRLLLAIFCFSFIRDRFICPFIQLFSCVTSMFN